MAGFGSVFGEVTESINQNPCLPTPATCCVGCPPRPEAPLVCTKLCKASISRSPATGLGFLSLPCTASEAERL